MATLFDFLNASANRKHAEELAKLESQLAAERTKQAQAGATEQAIKLRDSNQLASDFARHQAEQDTQQAIADKMIATGEYQNNPNLTPEQNRLAAQAQAAEKAAMIKVNQPLATATSALNLEEQAGATRPYNTELGVSGAQAGIGRNLETSALSNLNRQRYLGATPFAVKSGGAVEKATGLTAEERARRSAAAMPNIAGEATATAAENEERAARGAFEASVFGGKDPIAAAEAANAQAAQTSAVSRDIAAHPELSRGLWHPTGINALLGGFGGNVSGVPSSALTISPYGTPPPTAGMNVLPVNPYGLKPTGQKLIK